MDAFLSCPVKVDRAHGAGTELREKLARAETEIMSASLNGL